jgi:rhodanese-related sulfurtransferase
MADITVKEVKQRLDAGEKLNLIDVREMYEHQAGNIGGVNIPLGTLPLKLDEISNLKDQEVILYCRSGGRSGSAAMLLKQAGFANARNMIGGSLAWKAEIDPSYNVA